MDFEDAIEEGGDQDEQGASLDMFMFGLDEKEAAEMR